MANDLTGDFDVVAEFSVPAANRVLASMHRNGRFPHSLSLSVSDNPSPGTPASGPSVLNNVNVLGDPIVDQNQVGDPIPVPGDTASWMYSRLDPVINAGNLRASQSPVTPSHLQGVAQLQLAPPTIQVNDRSGSNVTVQMDIKSRYFPGPQTAPAAEFIRGQLQITAAVNQVASQAANVLDVAINADTVGIEFTPLWSSQPLVAADLAAVNQLIRNALKTSFMPSNTTLPSNIEYVQFKTLMGSPSAIGMLLNMQGARGNPGSFNNLLLGTADDFAFAAGRDFILNAFNSLSNRILNTPIPPVTFDYSVFWHTFHITYSVSLSSVALDLQAGKIVMTIKGHAHTGTSWMPDFDFTVEQDFTLQVDGDTANLVTGNISVDTSSWVANLFSGGATGALSQARDEALTQSGANNTVRSLLSADANLGGFLKSLLATRQGKLHISGFNLAYTSVDIQTSGITLHGSLAVPDWPGVHIEFEEIPPKTTSPVTGGVTAGLASAGPDYSALNSWIPGGEIQEFEWSYQGQTQPFQTDENKFVYIPQTNTEAAEFVYPSTPSAYSPICLTVRGSRPSASDPDVAQTVSGRACAYTFHPVINGLIPTVRGSALVALTQPGPDGLVQVTGYMPAEVDSTGVSTPNVIAHFADDKSAGQLAFLAQALREGGRQDAATALLAILTADQLTKVPYEPGIIYAADQDGDWARTLRAKVVRKPATLILNPQSHIVWQHEGDLDKLTLAAALRKSLVSGGSLGISVAGLNVETGRPSPNFLFEYAPGKELTLRKLGGRSVVLIFWNSSSEPSIEAARDFLKENGKNGSSPVLIAINDGESADLAKKISLQNGLSSATVVTDPKRQISMAYGVKIWPTTVFIDSLGVVSGIRYGRIPRK